MLSCIQSLLLQMTTENIIPYLTTVSEGKSGKDNLKEVSERTAGSILEQAMMSAPLLTWTAIERPRTSMAMLTFNISAK